jgi:DNA-binding response OmpR family regulator
MWSDKQHCVYSERTDLTPEAFELLVRLTLERRRVATSETLFTLWERDQETIAQFLANQSKATP